jgi:hypothetical protein
MALTKEVVIDKIEVLENGILQIREVTRIMEDGNELSSSYHRWVLNPGDDLSAQTDKVKTIANATWTPDVIAAYRAFVAEQVAKQSKFGV